MALRLEASSAHLQIDNIYIVDNRARLALEVAIPFATLAKRLFAQMVAAGIWVDADTKNRILNDLVVFGDVASLTTLKTLSDGFSAVDVTSLVVNKPVAAESISTSDNITKQVTFIRQFTDAMAVDDVMELAQNWTRTNNNVSFVSDVSAFLLTRPVTDTVGVSEVHTLHLDQVQTDAVNTADVATVTHYLGAAQLFNRPLFNQSTFG